MLSLSTRRTSGFTLLELVIVIAIIMVLAAVLFPVVYSGRQKAELSSCLQNQKQIAAAVLQYVDNNDGALPAGVKPVNKKLATWDVLVMKYVKSKDVFKCPEDATKGSRSYGYNDQAFRVNQDFGHTRMFLSQIKRPTFYIMLADTHNDANELGSPSYAMVQYAPDKDNQYHSGGTENNYAFFDGHVETKKLGELTNANFFFEVEKSHEE